MLHFFFWNAMTRRAGRNGLAAVGSLEMAEKANLFRYCDMFALDNLGVTTGATEPVAALHFADVNIMVENDVFFEYHLAVGKPLRMTSLLETDCVVHFRPRSRIIRIGNILQYIG